MGGGEQQPQDQCVLELREKLKGFLPRPASPEEARAPLLPSMAEGNERPLKGYTEDHLREAWRRYLDRKTRPRQPKRPAVAEGPVANDPSCSGSEAMGRDRPQTNQLRIKTALALSGCRG